MNLIFLKLSFSGPFPLKSYMNKADREKFLPAIKGFTNLLKKDVLNKAETEELLAQVRKLDLFILECKSFVIFGLKKF